MLQIVLDPERTWWSAIDHGAGKLSKRAGGMMKARGVKRGLPDFILMAQGKRSKEIGLGFVLGLELKVGKGTLSPDQIEVRIAWLAMGHGYYVARSLEEVQEILEHCHVPMRRRMVFFPKQGSPYDGGAHEPARRSVAARHPRARRQRKPKGDLPVVLS